MMKAIKRDEQEMKDSGIKWVQDIPKSWDVQKLKYILTERKEKNDPIITTDILSLTAEQGVIPYAERQGGGNKPKEDLTAYKVVRKGDIVLNSMNILSGAVNYSEYTGCVSPVYYTLYHENDIVVRYYNLIFQTEAFQKSLRGLGNGILIKESSNGKLNTIRMRIPMEKLGKELLPVPSIKEMQDIVSEVEPICSKIDTIIAEAKTSIEEYKELKQAVIYDAVTKGLDKNADMKDSGIPAIGKVNEKFKIAKIGELQEGLTDGTHGTYQRLDSGELLLSSKNVQNEGLVVGNNESFISTEDYKAIVANGFPQKNDILLCCIGASIGRCILYPYNYPIAFQRSVIFIRTNHWMLPKFMLYSLQSPSSIMQENVIVNQSAQAGFYQGLVKQLYVTVPSINEQNKIVSYLDKKIKNIDDVISTKESLIEDLEYYRKSLIYEVVTGKRKVVD